MFQNITLYYLFIYITNYNFDDWEMLNINLKIFK